MQRHDPLSIRIIPIDAWRIILSYIEESDVVKTYCRLFSSGALGIPVKNRLDVFHLVVEKRERKSEREVKMENAEDYRRILRTLEEFGVPPEVALHSTRLSRGSLMLALHFSGLG